MSAEELAYLTPEARARVVIEIVDDLEAALAEFSAVAENLRGRAPS